MTFDGQNFKLTGNCSYVLFHNKEQGLDVLLHNGACSTGARQACMKSIEVKHNGLSVELRSDMEVRGAFCESRNVAAADPWGSHVDPVAAGFSWCSCWGLGLLPHEQEGLTAISLVV